MSPESLRIQREQLAYIKDIKELILSDARALFATQGHSSHKLTLDVTTSTYAGAYQASLIMYPDLTTDMSWITLYEGLRCRTLCSAVKMLWDGLQTSLGVWKAMHAHRAAGVYQSPATSTNTARCEGTAASPETPMPVRVPISEVSAPSSESPEADAQSAECLTVDK